MYWFDESSISLSMACRRRCDSVIKPSNGDNASCMRFFIFDAEESRYARTMATAKRGRYRTSPTMGEPTFDDIIGDRRQPPAIVIMRSSRLTTPRNGNEESHVCAICFVHLRTT